MSLARAARTAPAGALCRVCLTCVAWLGVASLPPSASASQSVQLSATLSPERLGSDTTVAFAFTVTAPGGRVPAPLVGVALSYPENLGFALSGLGLETCARGALEALGLEGCPANSRMGAGTALAEIPVGPLVVREPAQVAVVRTATTDGRLTMLFYVNGEAPVIAQLVFAGLLLPANPPFGGLIGIDVPLVPGLPEGPDVSVVRLQATIGPEHLTYFERVGGKTVSYTPRGIVLPRVCPSGGFRFSGTFSFADGSQARADDAVPCPVEGSAARRAARRCKRSAAPRRARQGRVCVAGRPRAN